MGKDQNNSNSEPNSQIPSEEYQARANENSNEEDSLDPENAIEPEQENPTVKDPNLEKKSSGGKGRLFLLIAFISLCASTYVYYHKNGIDIAKMLPWDFKKSLQAIPRIPSSFDTKSKNLPVEPIENNTRQAESSNSPEKTINLLHEEIQSLKSKLKQQNATPLSSNIQNKIQQLDDSPINKNSTEINKTEEKEPIPEIKTLLTGHPPFKAGPLTQQNPIEEISPQRSREVQAYLDFVENTGVKLIDLFKKGWVRLQNYYLALKTLSN